MQPHIHRPLEQEDRHHGGEHGTGPAAPPQQRQCQAQLQRDSAHHREVRDPDEFVVIAPVQQVRKAEEQQDEDDQPGVQQPRPAPVVLAQASSATYQPGHQWVFPQEVLVRHVCHHPIIRDPPGDPAEGEAESSGGIRVRTGGAYVPLAAGQTSVRVSR